MRTFSKHVVEGMTIIESIIAVGILVMAILGPMSLAAYSLKTSRYSRDELIATMLGQEAIEIVASYRSNNSAQDASPDRSEWMSDIFPECVNGCIVDVTARSGGTWSSGALTACSSGDCTGIDRMYINTNSGLYRQSDNSLNNSSWRRTTFRRSVSIEGINPLTPPVHEVKVTVRVSFEGVRGFTRTLVFTDELFNWFPKLTP